MKGGLKDIAAALAILWTAGIALALVFRTVRSSAPRALDAVTVAAAAAAIWAHLAVGIF
jgi:hypothetical protein